MKNSRHEDAETGPVFLDCDHEPGDVTFSVLHADPEQRWGFAQPPLPFEREEDWGHA